MWRPLHHCLALLLVARICQSLDILNLHDYCGATITKNAGEIRFDAKKLPSYLPRNTCSVTITMQGDLSNRKPQIFFYFTKFDISIFCEDTNVTVVDGPRYDGTQVGGLPVSLCGHNKTLEEPDRYFETRGNQLTITFRRSEYGRRFSGNFSIKFVEFHTGECEGIDVYRCTDGHCIPYVYHCSSEIKACEAEVCTDEVDIGQTFLDDVKTAGIIFAVLAGLSLVGWVLRRIQGTKNTPILETLTGRRSSVGAHSVQLAGSPADGILMSTEEVQPDQIPLSSGRESPVSFTDVSSAERRSFSNTESRSYALRDVAMTLIDIPKQQTNVTPSAPPPSYDEVMAPSYDDVIAKSDDYQLSKK